MKNRQKAAKGGGKEARGEAGHSRHQNDKFTTQSLAARLKEHASDCETMDEEPGKDAQE